MSSRDSLTTRSPLSSTSSERAAEQVEPSGEASQNRGATPSGEIHSEGRAFDRRSLVIPERDVDFIRAVAELVDGAGEPDEDYCCWMLQVQRMNAHAFVVAGLAYDASRKKCGSFRYRNLGGERRDFGPDGLGAAVAFQCLSDLEDRESLAALYALAAASLSSRRRVCRVAMPGARRHWKRYLEEPSTKGIAFRRLRGITLFGLSLSGRIDVELLEPPMESALRAAWRTEWVHRARPTSEFPAWNLCGQIEDLVGLRLGNVYNGLDESQSDAAPHSIRLSYAKIGRLGREYESKLATHIPMTDCSVCLTSPTSTSSVADMPPREPRIFVDGSFRPDKIAIGGVVCDKFLTAYQFSFAAIPEGGDFGNGSSLAEALAYCVGQLINLSFWDGAAVVVGDSTNIFSKTTWPMVAVMAALQAKATGRDVRFIFKHEGGYDRRDYREVFTKGEWTPHKLANSARASHHVTREALTQLFDDIARQCRIPPSIGELVNRTFTLSDSQRINMLWLDSAPYNPARPVRFYQ
jgi:hypothetical protein